jgi:hypothetical protein
MSSPDPILTPSTSSPTTQALVFAGLRALLMVLGTFGITIPALTDSSNLTAVAGAVSVLIGIGWSFYQKFQDAQAAHRGATASAATGQAVKST